ncbi:MAG: hypothetical protein KGN76_14895 [Acidobacteriota bacterium]|nr:hypothetical protein [Acidobacteriota bacterium]
MPSKILGGAAGIVLLVWYVFWRIGLVGQLMRRAGLRRHREKPGVHG